MIPGKIISGEGALALAASELAQLGKKALVVTDSTMVKLGNVQRVAQVLTENGIGHSVFDAVNAEPDDTVVLAGAAQYAREGCDCLVAVGGGSPMDTMKAIALLSSRGGVPIDYMGKVVQGRLVPMAAVPTTAGTGSEATQFTIITDTKTQVKMLLKGPALLPDVAIIDPLFTLSAPPKITAATGVDALTHAIEAYTSRKAQPLSDTFALSAVKRIFSSLETAFSCPEHTESRTEMSLAALEAGIAFNNASVTIVRGMSRPIGALFHVPHGISNAMLLVACLRYVKDGALSRFADLARFCGMAGPASDDEKAANLFIGRVDELLCSLQIPTLEEYGIDYAAYSEAIPKMAQDAIDSGSPANTIRPITAHDIETLYRALYTR